MKLTNKLNMNQKLNFTDYHGGLTYTLRRGEVRGGDIVVRLDSTNKAC